MGDSAIHWTNKTWNPVTGCSKVSPGCAHCYAETLSLRYGYSKLPWLPKNADQNVILHPERLEAPLKWRKPSMIFVNSMSDLFHENVPDAFIASVFQVMADAKQHTFQVLTKRPERMATFLDSKEGLGCVAEATGYPYPLPNVWLGVSVENQYWADKRIPLLLNTPAAVRFLSCEPLLGPLNIKPYFYACSGCGDSPCDCKGVAIQWCIVGGESAGPKRRYMNLDWARAIRDQCLATGVPFFYKQSSAPRAGQGRELDGRLWEEYPS